MRHRAFSVCNAACSIYLAIYLSLFAQKAQKHNAAITYSGQNIETTMVYSKRYWQWRI